MPDDFYEVKIKHPRMRSVMNAVFLAIPDRQRMVMVAGPSGIGKTQLGNALREMIIADLKSKIAVVPSWIPVINVEAPPSYRERFTWGRFYIWALKALGLALKTNDVVKVVDEHGLYHRRTCANLSETELEELFLQQVNVRGCRCIIVDEAHQIMDDPDALPQTLNILKSLLNRSKVTLVLLGTYRQSEMLMKLPELTRRTTAIEFPRYDLTQGEKEVRAFYHLLDQLAILAKQPGLLEIVRSHPRLMYIGSLGLVGLLKPWIVRACAEAATQSRTVEVGDFETTMVPSGYRRRLLEEITDGERKFRGLLTDEKHILEMLGVQKMEEGDAFITACLNRKMVPKGAGGTEDGSADDSASDAVTNRATARKPFSKGDYRRSLGLVLGAEGGVAT